MQWPKCQKLYACLNPEMVIPSSWYIRMKTQFLIRSFKESHLSLQRRADRKNDCTSLHARHPRQWREHWSPKTVAKWTELTRTTMEKVKPGEVVAEGLGILGELHCVSRPMGPDQVELFRNQVRSWF